VSFINEKCLASGVGGSTDTIHSIRPAGNPPSITVVMVTAGQSACGPVTTMRSLSSALGHRHDQEGAASHRPGGGSRRDGHDRRDPGSRQRGPADDDQAPARSSVQARVGCRRGGHRVRSRGPGGVRPRTHRRSRKAPAAGGKGGSPARSRPPGARGVPRAGQVTGTRRGPAPGWRPVSQRPVSQRPVGRRPVGRRAVSRRPVSQRPVGRRSCHPRRQSAFRAATRAEPDERVLAGRAHRRAPGWLPPRNAGWPGHPGDPAHGGTRPGSGRADPRSSGGRMDPGPALLRLARTSAAAARLPARDEPGRSRPGAVRTWRPAGAARAAP